MKLRTQSQGDVAHRRDVHAQASLCLPLWTKIILMTKSFELKRFWCPRGESFDLSDRGFLSDPEVEWSKYLNPKLVTFEKIAELPCAVLLGEPGIGKSWTLQQESAEVHRSLTADARVISLDLRSVGDECRLMSLLFDSKMFENWRKSNWLLHVFLDSLDECLLRIDNLSALLADEFPKQPVERLRLRIACRTAPWPAILEKALVGLFLVNARPMSCCHCGASTSGLPRTKAVSSIPARFSEESKRTLKFRFGVARKFPQKLQVPASHLRGGAPRQKALTEPKALLVPKHSLGYSTR